MTIFPDFRNPQGRHPTYGHRSGAVRRIIPLSRYQKTWNRALVVGETGEGGSLFSLFLR
jgi:hypothetical protein